MVALPAVKFVFLGIRQLTRPVVRRVVTRAMERRSVTYKVCIVLGRVSLGFTGVIAEWSRTEQQKRLEGKKKMEESARAEAAKKAAEAEEEKAVAPPAITITSALRKAEPAPAAEAEAEKLHHTSLDSLVAPRSRSLLAEITYGPLPKEQDTYDRSVFLDPKRTAGEAARVFIWHPYRSAWDVFRQTFLVPFPEKRLVDAGAELLIELSAYVVLALLLFWELQQQSRAAAAKEAHLQARLEAIEAKVNELARVTQRHADARAVDELAPVPELQVDGRLYALWKATELGVATVAQALFAEAPGGGAAPAVQVRHGGEKGGGAAGLSYTPHSRVPQQTPDPRVRLSKHDETAPMKKELERVLRDSGIAINK
ncbi:hypothetical protein STCU_01173 [Strigomonas culicis]|uniref:Optic atrophy 3 protein (OPA3) n=1 Tax=Strigomonas culicis TaxID=28005 RepID=S9V2I3_9TRYP|nr:hypothetical protein STCU_01173 [Strigomonas culicis]|eukprot:EPY35254.1 hypothetical protein STCU_01173 [Strigomonas culicis]